MNLNVKTVRNLAFVCLVALAMTLPTLATVEADACDRYCGDGECQEEGCSQCGCETPGNGCVEKVGNCDDCLGK